MMQNWTEPDWLSAVMASIAVGFSFWAHHSAEKTRKRADEIEAQNAKLLGVQSELARQSWSDEYFREITSWSCNVSMAISKAIHLIEVGDTDAKRDTLITLSACVDMGRWYFPNRDHDQIGTDKEPAYRGVRQPCLDWIVLAYNVLSERKNVLNPREQLVTCQRNFVSCLQEVLDPRSRAESIERVLNDFKSVSCLPSVKSPPE